MPKMASTTSSSKGSKGLKQWTASNLEDVRRLAAEREHSSNKDTSNGYIHNVKFFLDDPRYSVLQNKFSFEEVREKISRNILALRKTAAYKERMDKLDNLTNHSTRCYAIVPKDLLSKSSTPLISVIFLTSSTPLNHLNMLCGSDSVKTQIESSAYGSTALSNKMLFVLVSPATITRPPAIIQDRVCFLQTTIVRYTYDEEEKSKVRMKEVQKDNQNFQLRPLLDQVIR